MSNKAPGVVVIGASAGGGEALTALLSGLPANFPLPIVVVQHLHEDDHGSFAMTLDPLERNGSISLSADEKHNWSRPSVDVLFESAAYAFGAQVTAILLSGGNQDGTAGMELVKKAGGTTIAQDPQDAVCPIMPEAAIHADVVDKVMTATRIAEYLKGK